MAANLTGEKRILLQSVLTPSESICREPRVFFHETAEGGLDFDGYFNLFYIEKRKRYTSVMGLELSLQIKNVLAVTLMHDRNELQSYVIKDDHEELTEVTFSFPYEEYDKGVFWFRVRKADPEKEITVTGGFYGLVKSLWNVGIFVDICTYKREEYVIRNISNLISFFKSPRGKALKDHITVGIVDNGNTLKYNNDLGHLIGGTKNIQLYPNANTGGSGGFTRGMKEAIELRKKETLTHVLLMDDDASFDMDLFVRLYGMLVTLKEEYLDITIGGTICREDYSYILHAGGEWFENFEATNNLRNLDLRDFDNCTVSELTGTENEFKRYSGWWCCCYSLNVATKNNLPLPLFVHWDDIEYEVRNRKKGNPIVFLNGVGVWHRAFDSELRLSKDYYNYRNKLIHTVIHEPEKLDGYFKKILRKELTGTFINKRYLEMEYIYRGVRDFLRGKDWLYSLDQEAWHRKASDFAKKNLHYIALDEFDKYGFGNLKEEAKEYMENGISAEELLERRNRGKERISFIRKISLNGSLFPAKRGAVLIRTEDELWEKEYRYRKLLFLEKGKDRVIYVRQDLSKVFRMMHIYRQLRKLYRSGRGNGWNR